MWGQCVKGWERKSEPLEKVAEEDCRVSSEKIKNKWKKQRKYWMFY